MDEFVPVSVCLDFAKDFLKGLKQLMKEIGLDNHDENDWSNIKLIYLNVTIRSSNTSFKFPFH